VKITAVTPTHPTSESENPFDIRGTFEIVFGSENPFDIRGTFEIVFRSENPFDIRGTFEIVFGLEFHMQLTRPPLIWPHLFAGQTID
jgi:hypothetical protein